MATIEGVDAALRQKREEIERTGFHTQTAAQYHARVTCYYCGCLVGDTVIHRRTCFATEQGGKE